MLKTLALITAVCTGSTAFAADMAIKAPVAPRAVIDSWTGLYLGLQGGANLGSFNPIFGTGKAATDVNLDDNNWFVGGHMGYMLQSGNFVAGPEFGVQYWGLKSQGTLVPATTDVAAVLLQQKIDWLAYANIRAGLTLFTPNTLLYITGGAAWAHAKGEVINLTNLNTAFEQTAMGWNVGVGLELKLGEYLILGGEYRHYDFGNLTANPIITIGLKPDSMTVDQAMARLSYKLN